MYICVYVIFVQMAFHTCQHSCGFAKCKPPECCERKWFRYCLFSSAEPSLRSQNVLRILRWKTIEVCGDYPPPPIRFSCGFAVLKTFLVRRRTETQRYKGTLFEQLESGCSLTTLSFHFISFHFISFHFISI